MKINKTEKKKWKKGLHYNFDPSGKKRGYLGFSITLGGFGIEIRNPSKGAHIFKVCKLIEEDKRKRK